MVPDSAPPDAAGQDSGGPAGDGAGVASCCGVGSGVTVAAGSGDGSGAGSRAGLAVCSGGGCVEAAGGEDCVGGAAAGPSEPEPSSAEPVVSVGSVLVSPSCCSVFGAAPSSPAGAGSTATSRAGSVPAPATAAGFSAGAA